MSVSLRYFAAIGLCAAVAQSAPAQDRPNILVMVVDDMRWDDFGAAGHSFVETPNIDRLAREGAMFRNAFTTTPLCSPARGALLTGQYPHTNGIIDNIERGPRSHEMNTFPRELDRAGYETAFVGKWHMGRDDSRRPGFDYWVTMRGQGSVLNPTIIEGDQREQMEGHVTEIFTDKAVGFLQRDHEDPFLLYVAYKALHPGRGGLTAGGFHAPEAYEGRYENATVTRRPNYGIVPTDKPALMRNPLGLPPLSEATVTPDQTIRDRMEMLLGIDESVGRMLKVLEDKGELANTLVIFTSDHGYFYGEHALNAERRFAYEETARIPLLVRHPSIEAGIRPEQMVLSIDLAPTVLEMGGVTPGAELQGRSLVQILGGQTPASWRTSFLIEHHTDPDSYLGRSVLRRATGMGYQAVRTERYKYIQFTELEGMNELYDLQEDPYELKNLIDDSDSAELLERMKAELQKVLRETS